MEPRLLDFQGTVQKGLLIRENPNNNNYDFGARPRRTEIYVTSIFISKLNSPLSEKGTKPSSD